MKGRTGHKEPKKTISKSVVKAARVKTHDGHYGSDAKKTGGKVSGKRAAARPDRRARGGRCVDDDEVVGLKDTGEHNGDNDQPKTGYKSGGGIHIKPENKGKLTKEVGKKGLKPSNLRKEIAHDKAAGNVAKEKREVFALNAKTKFHH